MRSRTDAPTSSALSVWVRGRERPAEQRHIGRPKHWSRVLAQKAFLRPRTSHAASIEARDRCRSGGARERCRSRGGGSAVSSVAFQAALIMNRARLKRMSAFPRACILIGISIATACATAVAGTVEQDVPSAVDPNAKYLFYMHGYAIERGGAEARTYHYSGILKDLAQRGFIVIGEERSAVRNDMYADKVAGQVRKLLAAGVPAKNITVAGHSKGGMIAMLVMAKLADPGIAYVNFAGCGRPGSGFEGYRHFGEGRAAKARGVLLSAYDRSDRIAGSCKPALDKMTGAVVAERVLDIGGGHELFYTPKAEWLDILQTWAQRRQ